MSLQTELTQMMNLAYILQSLLTQGLGPGVGILEYDMAMILEFDMNMITCSILSFPDDSVAKESACNSGDTAGSIPRSGRFPGGGNGNPLQYYLENSMDRGAWWATVYVVMKSQTWLSN